MAGDVHVHVGCGALGLGLIGAVARERGGRFVVASRTASASKASARRMADMATNGGYEILVKPTLEKVVVRVDDVVSTDADPEGFATLIADPGTFLVTTALGLEGLEAFTPYFADALCRRERDAGPVYVIACENRTGAAYDALTGTLDPEIVRFRHAVVDRICLGDKGDTVLETGAAVDVEEFWQWIIGIDPAVDALLNEAFTALQDPDATASTAPGLFLVEDLAPYLLRKQWLVNAPHTTLAVLAHAFGGRFLDTWLSTYEGERLATLVFREFRDGLYRSKHAPFSVDQLAEFSDLVGERFAAFPDLVSRIIKRLRRDSLEPFCAEMYEKIAAKAFTYFRSVGAQPTWMNYAVFNALEAITEGRFIDEPWP